MVCGVRVERRFLTDHQKNECKYRQYTCEYCGHSDTYDAIAGTGSVRANQYLFGNTMNHYGKCAEFPIKCRNECGVTSLKRKDLKAHLGTCPLESISCPFSNCSLGSILRKDVETHIKVCYYRPYTCEHCGTAGTYLSITNRGESPSHYDTCDHYPIECPNKCGISEKRKDMPTHRDTCPLQPTDCPFKTVGCTATIARQDMDSHVQMNMQQHLLMMVKSLEELTHKNEEFTPGRGT